MHCIFKNADPINAGHDLAVLVYVSEYCLSLLEPPACFMSDALWFDVSKFIKNNLTVCMPFYGSSFLKIPLRMPS
jgi:hypothetical protein